MAITPQGMYAKANVPARHTCVVRESPPEWVKARDRVCGMVASGFTIALIGARGPGKTQIGQQAILRSCAMERTSLYVRAMTLLVELKTTNSPMAYQTAEDVFTKYREPRLLVIDEMQERGETEFENRMLNHICDLRYADLNDTLIIANLTPKNLVESLGSSIIDRLAETGGIIECDWESQRKHVD